MLKLQPISILVLTHGFELFYAHIPMGEIHFCPCSERFPGLKVLRFTTRKGKWVMLVKSHITTKINLESGVLLIGLGNSIDNLGF